MGFLKYINGAREQVEALLAMITALEVRQGCAMANVYANDKDSLPPLPKPPAPEITKRQRKLGLV